MQEKQITPQAIIEGVQEKKEAFQRAEVDHYSERTKLLSRKAAEIFDSLWNGEKFGTKERVEDNEVALMLNGYIQTKIDEYRLRIEHPDDFEDFKNSSIQLQHYSSIAKGGGNGLAKFCQSIINNFSREQSVREITSHFIPIVDRWQHYKSSVTSQQRQE